jgi:hypothetical protein
MDTIRGLEDAGLIIIAIVFCILWLLVILAPLACWGNLRELVRIQRKILARMEKNDSAKYEKSLKRFIDKPITADKESDSSKYGPK